MLMLTLCCPGRGQDEHLRQRTQRQLTGEHGRVNDPLYRARHLLRCGTNILTEKQQARLDALWVSHDETAALEVT